MRSDVEYEGSLDAASYAEASQKHDPRGRQGENLASEETNPILCAEVKINSDPNVITLRVNERGEPLNVED
jgi:hypothetical protein